MCKYDSKPWIKLPLGELTTPQEGKICKSDRWWVVTEDNCVLFLRNYYAPQCNHSQLLAKMLHKELNVVFVPMAYVPDDNW